MAVNKMPGGVLTGHHSGATGGADGVVDREILEIDTFGGHAVQIWGFAEGAAVNIEVAVAPIVGEDEYYIRPVGRREKRAEKARGREEE
jgi:hypothetical protein